MEAQKNDLKKVGIFVTLGVFMLMTSIVLIDGDKMFFQDYISFSTHLSNVQGLHERSVVSISGIKAGNITKIEMMDNSDEIKVTMNIFSRFHHRLTTSSLVSVKTQGALGDKYIFIQPGLATDPKVEQGGLLLSSKEKDIFDLFAEKGPQFASAADIIEQVNILMNNINADGRSAKLMENFVQVSHNLNLVLQDIRGSKDSKGVQHSLRSLASVLEKVDKGEGTLGALVNDSTLHEQLLRFVGDSPRNKFLKPLIRASIKESEQSEK